MPRRTLLSSEQRARLFAIPIDGAEMARHYVLSPEDLHPSGRSDARSIGWASPSNFALLRHPGQRPRIQAEHPPEPMIAFVGKAGRCHPALFGDYALPGRKPAGNMWSNFRSFCGFAPSGSLIGVPA